MVGLAANEMEKEKRDLEVCLELCLSLEGQCALRLKVPDFVARPHVRYARGSLPVRLCRRPFSTWVFHLQNTSLILRISELKGLSGHIPWDHVEPE